MSNAVAIIDHSRAVNGVSYYRQGTDVAGACREIVLKTAMSIQGRKYVRVEGWQAIATAYGCSVEVGDVRRVLDEGAGGFAATAHVRRLGDGSVMGQGEGFVGDDEGMWAKRPVFARRAMAQTRAVSRACRSAFAYIVVMIDAGLSTTPAEEMEGVEPQRAAATPPPPPAQRARDLTPIAHDPDTGEVAPAKAPAMTPEAWLSQHIVDVEDCADATEVEALQQREAAKIASLRKRFPALADKARDAAMARLASFDAPRDRDAEMAPFEAGELAA